MTHLAVIGAQWGDEGKGKVVDLLSPRFSVVARYQGGPNAGHTVVFGGKTHALHHIPSGIFHPGVTSVIGPGTLIDPERLLAEIEGLAAQGIEVDQRLRISLRSHVIMPWHLGLDGGYEARLEEQAIGTTRRGIGPAYSAKMERFGVRVADLARPEELAARYRAARSMGLAERLEALGETMPTEQAIQATARQWWQRLGPLCCDTTDLLHAALRDGRAILFEGAQGTLLDVDHGSYPFVTSSSTGAGGIPAGLGVPPRAVEQVVGVAKAYLTRVGAGPFPSEDDGSAGQRLRQVGKEFGTTTGRPRRCGWFDAVAARYAVRLSGIDALALTKFDVLSGLPEVRIAVAYEIDGERCETLPAVASDLERAEVVYEDLEGWSEPLEHVRCLADLPRAARVYLDRIEELAECPLALVSVGPDRTQTIVPGGSLLEDFGVEATR
ncbi:MAG TPA: adenylosuccinate synthase [Acidobacteria bacterium]|nr:adenylosuccinate synthase [Acidobacteriota bacterium]